METRARLLGGSLDVVSQGKGTRIRVRLPLAIEHTA
jgi:signal transduction histidine kinase